MHFTQVSVHKQKERIRQRLEAEVGRIEKQAPFTIAHCYPSPYAAAMSSLGYQRIYRAVMEAKNMACERAFLDDEAASNILAQTAPITYESRRPLSQFSVISFSVAYELEILGFLKILHSAHIPLERNSRDERHPFILVGGPLTFSNPLPLNGFVDAMVIGEAEEIVVDVLSVLESTPKKIDRLTLLSRIPHVHVPEVHGEYLPPVARAHDDQIPAWAPIRTPHTVLSNMFLLETERGCSRSCTYCVMRRGSQGGMRLASKEKILSLIPHDAKRVGLVGAAVSDHPKIIELVDTMALQGREVGLSSLRPDRLTEAFVMSLKRAGYKTLTTAMDGPSERLREILDRKAKVKHLERCAENARRAQMERMKLYLMIGLPGEADSDIDECIDFTTELSKRIPLSLGIAPFCAKKRTPLEGHPFAGIDALSTRLHRLKRGLRGRVDVRSTSAKWAWVEYILAQGGEKEGLALVSVMEHGGTFAAYRDVFGFLGEGRTQTSLATSRVSQVDKDGSEEAPSKGGDKKLVLLKKKAANLSV